MGQILIRRRNLKDLAGITDPGDVFRFSRPGPQSMLNNYNHQSGHYIELTLGWLSGKLNLHRSLVMRAAGSAKRLLLPYMQADENHAQ